MPQIQKEAGLHGGQIHLSDGGVNVALNGLRKRIGTAFK